MKTTELKIKCPLCGAEYLPAEIFLPNSLIGYPTDIQKSTDGKILTYMGKSVDLDETYICDNCGKSFKIKAKLSFETEYNSKYDFSEDYCTKKYQQLSLFED